MTAAQLRGFVLSFNQRGSSRVQAVMVSGYTYGCRNCKYRDPVGSSHGAPFPPFLFLRFNVLFWICGRGVMNTSVFVFQELWSLRFVTVFFGLFNSTHPLLYSVYLLCFIWLTAFVAWDTELRFDKQTRWLYNSINSKSYECLQ